MLLIYIDDSLLASLPTGEFDSMMRNCLSHAEHLRAQGPLLDSQQLEPASTAKSIRTRSGQLAITDGPVAEAKEVLGGFNLIEAENIDEAVKIALSFPWSKIGCVEVRPVRDIAGVRQRVYAGQEESALKAG